MDKLTKEQRSKNMKAVKNKGSKIESLLMKALWKKGYRYRKNDRKVYGTPDIVFTKLRIAVFCDSEFWHGKNWEHKKYEHKSNVEFWHKKIEGNIIRDREVNDKLKQNGWIVIRFWGTDIKKKLDICLGEIESVIQERQNILSSQKKT
jgi:DNA mismatch endonuclease Vsr